MSKKQSTKELVCGSANEKRSRKDSEAFASEERLAAFTPSFDDEYDDEATSQSEERLEKVRRKAPPKLKISRRPISSLLKSKFFVGIVCLALAVFLAFVGIPMAQIKINDTVTVVRFSQNVAAPSVVTDDAVIEEQASKYNLPLGYISSKADVVGKYITSDAVKGDIATSGRVSDTYPGDDPALAFLPDGKYAVSFTLPSVAASLSSKLRAGDVIQIFAAFDRERDEDGYCAQIPSELQYVEVLSVTDSAAGEIKENYSKGEKVSSALSGGEISVIQNVTVLVNQAQAAAIAGLEYSANLHTALVCRGNEALKSQLLQMQESLIKTQAEQQPEQNTDKKEVSQ